MMMPPAAKAFTEKQVMLAFAFMADVDSGEAFLISSPETYGKRRITKALTDKTSYPEVASQLDGWTLKYGPATYLGHHLDDWLVRNSTLIFYNAAEKHWVIAMAGTNFVSRFDWFTEDLEVQNLVPWNDTVISEGGSNQVAATGGYIATGTALWAALENELRRRIAYAVCATSKTRLEQVTQELLFGIDHDAKAFHWRSIHHRGPEIATASDNNRKRLKKITTTKCFN